ncbi:response regulator transcription factor [Aminipila luticellarii]|uniref:Stage 0 sporulation protein A homolog n=1 Tax=Aminipila luticellarii TaxID=2507160 RepID=A0A410PX11_9FIRM|nr:response regulator [Aminipila luticellarii]QAT43406.1 response regulator [Aminipila luticellarii]
MYKLLIAEDEELERMALKKIIERNFSNINVIKPAKNGEEAVNFARIHMPDILLIDIRMPVKNGIEAHKQIIKFHPAIKTIIITAHSEFVYAQEAIKYNVYDFLLKPVSPDVICSCIQSILSSAEEAAASAHTTETPFSQEVITQCLKIIELNYLNDLTLSSIAKQVHLSEKYFSRYFKMKTGYTFTQYIQILKINRAKTLLLDTNIPIFRIAMDLKFSDSAYFTKVFFKHEGLTPSQYRQQFAKN